MVRKRKKTDPFKKLTWDDLQDWAGSKIVSRGKRYHRKGHVQRLALTSTGGLIAWVEGSQRYVTRVEIKGRTPESTCTCPYWDTCKHAVAVVLEYLDHLKKGIKVLQVAEAGSREKLLQELSEDRAWDQDDEVYVEYEVDSGGAHDSNMTAESLETFLKLKTKTQLISLIRDMSERYPVVRETMQDMQDLAEGKVKSMVRALREEIYELSAEPGWRNYWNDEGYTPDYSRVRERMEALLAQGHADDVVALGKELLEMGTHQVGMSYDQGETLCEISACLDIVFRALPHSSLSPAEQMVWAVEAELEDEYSLCEGVQAFWEQKHKVADWKTLADNLTKRLKDFQWTKADDGFTRNYRRDRLSDWLIEALENAGRREEVIPLCEREAKMTGSYVRLVRLLQEANRFKEAEEWINKGIKATRKKWPGIAGTLRTEWQRMREKQGDWLSVAACRAEDFFREPTLHSFKELQEAAERAEAWPSVRKAAMHYLRDGKFPWNSSSWPLPETGLQNGSERWQMDFPLAETLIDIAISENKPDEVIRWYDQRKTSGLGWRWSGPQEEAVAKALVDQYPDRAVSIWKSLAENQIALTKPKAYTVAAGYLRKVRRLLKKMGKEKEWQHYLLELRQANARKIRLMEILDTLEGRPIIDGL